MKLLGTKSGGNKLFPNGERSNVEKELKFMENLGKKLGFTKKEDWYQIRSKHIVDHGGHRILQSYDGLPSKLLASVYPSHNWLQNWGIKIKPRGYWNSQTNQREFMDDLGRKLGFISMDDWYKLTVRNLEEHGGGGLLDIYNGSPSKLLQSIYPNHKWDVWGIQIKPKGYWKIESNQRKFMDDLGRNLGVASMDDWYKFSVRIMYDHGGSGLLSVYNGSPSKLLQSVYPNHKWHIWKFETVPMKYWNKKSNQREFMDDLGGNLGFVSMDDWYKLSLRTLDDYGGRGLLDIYNDSPSNLLQSIYPKHNWQIWKFERTPKECQVKKKDFTPFMDWISSELKIKHPEEWYQISSTQMKQFVPVSFYKIFSRPDTLFRVLSQAYPNYSWNLSKLNSTTKNSSQENL